MSNFYNEHASVHVYGACPSFAVVITWYSECIAVVISWLLEWMHFMTTTVNALLWLSQQQHTGADPGIYIRGSCVLAMGLGTFTGHNLIMTAEKCIKKAIGLLTPERKPFSLDERTFFLFSLSLSLSLSQSYERLNGRDFHLTASS